MSSTNMLILRPKPRLPSQPPSKFAPKTVTNPKLRFSKPLKISCSLSDSLPFPPMPVPVPVPLPVPDPAGAPPPPPVDWKAILTALKASATTFLVNYPLIHVVVTGLVSGYLLFVSIPAGLRVFHSMVEGNRPFDRTVSGALERPLSFFTVCHAMLYAGVILFPTAYGRFEMLKPYIVGITLLWFLDNCKTTLLRNAFRERAQLHSENAFDMDALSAAGTIVLGGWGLSCALGVAHYFYCFLICIAGTTLFSLGFDLFGASIWNFVAAVQTFSEFLSEHPEGSGDLSRVND